MKLYLKLALDGIRKNRRLYLPYMLTGAAMVMMYFILSALSVTPVLTYFKGGAMLRMILPFGVWVVAVFAAIFLFYCNAFIIRQRNREFGLYNVLGMGKANLTGLMAVENLLTAFLSIAGGLALGLSLEKLAELGMLRILGEEIDYEMHIEVSAIWDTVKIFGGIYLFLLVSAVIRVWHCNPLELLKSAEVGEKPPKANWLIALLGLIILAAAYYLAMVTKHPIDALVYFFAAVIMVIIATYMLFVADSVVLCRLLQRNPRYYYKANHFVSVSTMVYRMKRNGAGLASICILITMVLVTLSSVLCLYIGAEDTLMRAYPRDIIIGLTLPDESWLTEENLSTRRERITELVPEQVEPSEYLMMEAYGLVISGEDAGFLTDSEALKEIDPTMNDVGNLTVRELADFNRATGRTDTLLPDECLLVVDPSGFECKTFTVDGIPPYRVKAILDGDSLMNGHMLTTITTIMMVVPDLPAFLEMSPDEQIENTFRSEKWRYGFDRANSFRTLEWTYGFDLPGGAPAHEAAYNTLMNHMDEWAMPREEGGFTFRLAVREMERSDFYGLYGGLFFVGLMLSSVFLFAAILIVYYKQLSEGYEDQKRFAIMQKVGMTKKEIRRSINSQVLTVFFTPLLMAGVHLTFAFPMIWKLLKMFNLTNMKLMIVVTACSFVVFGLVYALVYKITSNVYYGIVSGAKAKHN